VKRLINKVLNKERQFRLGNTLYAVQTEFSDEDKVALMKLLGEVACPNMKVVEVGSWIGSSTAVIADHVSVYNGKVIAVDHWQGNPGVAPHRIADRIDVFLVFKYNMIALGLWDCVCPIVTDSITASTFLADESFDLVFIDADHSYEAVKADIQAWTPKVKHGGILCGHDYSASHEGLKQAVDELLKPKVKVMPHGSIWYVRKTTPLYL